MLTLINDNMEIILDILEKEKTSFKIKSDKGNTHDYNKMVVHVKLYLKEDESKNTQLNKPLKESYYRKMY